MRVIDPLPQSCQDLSCLCTNPVAAQIAQCANCLIGLGDDLAANQAIIDRESFLIPKRHEMNKECYTPIPQNIPTPA